MRSISGVISPEVVSEEVASEKKFAKPGCIPPNCSKTKEELYIQCVVLIVVASYNIYPFRLLKDIIYNH